MADDNQPDFDSMNEKEMDEHLKNLETAPDDETPPEEKEPLDSEEIVDEDSQEIDGEPELDPEPEPEKDTALEIAEKRFADGQRKITELGNQNALLQQQLTSLTGEVNTLKAKPKEKVSPPANKELDTFKEEYPEIARGFESMLASRDEHIVKLEGMIGDVNQATGTVAKTAAKTAESVAKDAADKHVQAFLKLHPDGQEIVNDPAWAKWLNEQPDGARYHEIISEKIDNLPLADSIMNAYKKDAGIGELEPVPEPKNDSSKIDEAKKIADPPHKNRARDPNYKPKNAVLFTQSQVDSWNRAEFLKNEDALTKAIMSGQFDANA